MKYLARLSALVPLVIPAVASAAITITFGSDSIFDRILSLINDVLVPLIFAIAFIVFLWGVFKYFIAGATEPESRKKGGQLVLYGVIGFAIMVSVWGLVNVVTNTFSLDSQYHPAFPTL